MYADASPSPYELPGRHFEYRYDSIGNRQTSGETGSADTADDHYVTNSLNQYTAKENNVVRVVGTAAAGANIAVSNSPGATKVDHAWGADLVPSNQNSAVQGTATIYAGIPGSTDTVASTTKQYVVPKALQALGYDADGNLTSDGIWIYTYDAENRLVSMTNQLTAVTGFSRWNLAFVYDYLGRRVQKSATNLDDSTKDYARRYIYDGWNLIAELDATGGSPSLNLMRSYTWGLDLTGDLTRSGGVGALLQMYDYSGSGTTFWPTYDGNGNVATLIDAANGTIAATYEYDPYGNYLRADTNASYAMLQSSPNPFRFSGKFTDVETGLVYYGLRYYSPVLGRFINKDPIEESGGLNLYGFVGNNAISGLDFLGLDDSGSSVDCENDGHGGASCHWKNMPVYQFPTFAVKPTSDNNDHVDPFDANADYLGNLVIDQINNSAAITGPISLDLPAIGGANGSAAPNKTIAQKWKAFSDCMDIAKQGYDSEMTATGQNITTITSAGQNAYDARNMVATANSLINLFGNVSSVSLQAGGAYFGGNAAAGILVRSAVINGGLFTAESATVMRVAGGYTAGVVTSAMVNTARGNDTTATRDNTVGAVATVADEALLPERFPVFGSATALGLAIGDVLTDSAADASDRPVGIGSAFSRMHALATYKAASDDCLKLLH